MLGSPTPKCPSVFDENTLAADRVAYIVSSPACGVSFGCSWVDCVIECGFAAHPYTVSLCEPAWSWWTLHSGKSPAYGVFVVTNHTKAPYRIKKQTKVTHPRMMGDGTEEQNLGERGNPAARIMKKELAAAFSTWRSTNNPRR